MRTGGHRSAWTGGSVGRRDRDLPLDARGTGAVGAEEVVRGLADVGRGDFRVGGHRVWLPSVVVGEVTAGGRRAVGADHGPGLVGVPDDAAVVVQADVQD